MKNKVSIIWLSWSPTRERYEIAKRCFTNLLKVTKHPHELIVADNGPEYQTTWLHRQNVGTVLSPGINIGVGPARNMAVGCATGKYLAFIDNDLLLWGGWLGSCVQALQTYRKRKLIATVRLENSHLHSKADWCVGALDDYELWTRAGGGTLVMRRQAFIDCGPWCMDSTVGTQFAWSAQKKGYRFIRHPSWNARHIARRSYYWKQQLFEGNWRRPEHVEERTLDRQVANPA